MPSRFRTSSTVASAACRSGSRVAFAPTVAGKLTRVRKACAEADRTFLAIEKRRSEVEV